MTPLLGIPGIPQIPRACSQKLVLEQHSFTVADFCCPLTHLPGIPQIPRACSKKLVLEQHSFTFASVAESRLLCVGYEHWPYLSVET